MKQSLILSVILLVVTLTSFAQQTVEQLNNKVYGNDSVYTVYPTSSVPTINSASRIWLYSTFGDSVSCKIVLSYRVEGNSSWVRLDTSTVTGTAATRVTKNYRDNTTETLSGAYNWRIEYIFASSGNAVKTATTTRKANSTLYIKK